MARSLPDTGLFAWLSGMSNVGALTRLAGLGCALALLMALVGCVAPDIAATPVLTVTAPSPAPVATSTAIARPTPDIERIRTRLQRTDSLQGVAGQCADAIGSPASLARVRIEQPAGDGCTPCNKLPIGYVDRGVPITEVGQPLADGSWIWLTVENLLCIYLFDAGEFKPSSVTQW